MYPTLKDIKTGETRTCILEDFSVFWWTEGNGSCDCNRAVMFDKSDELDRVMRQNNPELKEHQSYCFGSERFIAIDVYGNLEGMGKREIIIAMNSGYKMND